MPREFVYDGRSYGDPNPKLSVEEMRQYLANFLTELSNATTTETKKPGKDGEEVTVITFTRRVGTKGVTKTQVKPAMHYRLWDRTATDGAGAISDAILDPIRKLSLINAQVLSACFMWVQPKYSTRDYAKVTCELCKKNAKSEA